MAMIIILNVVISAIGIAIVAGGMRFGYLFAGEVSEPAQSATQVVPAQPTELERAA
jgi:hypothetical protein